jgi:glycerol kinase
VIESIAFLLRANFDAMNRLVGPPERIVVAGGLSRAQALVERIAALLGTDVHRLEEAEGTTLGLWCRLRGAGLDSGAFRRLPGGDRAALEARYRHWLGLMPPVGP